MDNITEKIGLGCMGMSVRRNPEDSIKTIHAALDEGITLFNTGEFYGMGESEMIVGQALKGVSRDRYFLSVKFGMLSDPSGRMYGMDTSTFHIKARLAYSMRRLGVDYIDLYQPARIDETIPVEETVGALAELVKEGYIGHIGLSEVDADTLKRASMVHPIHTVEVEYSIIDRDIEKDLIPAARDLGVNLLTFGLLSHGLLSDTVIGGTSQPSIKFGRFAPENLSKNQLVLEQLKNFAYEKNATVAQRAYAWAFSKNPEMQCLVGTTKPAHLKNAMEALDISLSQEDIVRMEHIVSVETIVGTGMRGVRFSGGKPVFR